MSIKLNSIVCCYLPEIKVETNNIPNKEIKQNLEIIENRGETAYCTPISN